MWPGQLWRNGSAAWRSLNHNVKMVLLFSFFNPASESLYAKGFLSIYIFMLADSSNAVVGYTVRYGLGPCLRSCVSSSIRPF